MMAGRRWRRERRTRPKPVHSCQRETRLAELRPIHVSLVVVPDVALSTLGGIYDVLNAFGLLSSYDQSVPKTAPFNVEIVAPTADTVATASGLPVPPHRPIGEVTHTDIVIVPSMLVPGGDWVKGRYPEVVHWLADMHHQGAMLCSACSGALLVAETGLLDGKDATMHWAYAHTFRRNFPKVRLRLEEVLVTTGRDDRFVMSGASTSWHDLVLYLVARQVGPAAAQAVAKFFALQWHGAGQAPYVLFDPPTDHGDAMVRDAQSWLATHFSVGSPVEELVKRSGLAERSFKRRFTAATGYSPIAYVQRLRIEDAKRRLERTVTAADEIGWAVGYEDPAFFRRLFKRVTGLTPGAYRRMFRVPSYGGRRPSDDPGRTP